MSDWAAKHAERWALWYDGENDTKVYDAIEGAVREALAKAAEVADANQSDCEDDGCNLRHWNRRLVEAIRALGAAKEAK